MQCNCINRIPNDRERPSSARPVNEGRRKELRLQGACNSAPLLRTCLTFPFVASKDKISLSLVTHSSMCCLSSIYAYYNQHFYLLTKRFNTFFIDFLVDIKNISQFIREIGYESRCLLFGLKVSNPCYFNFLINMYNLIINHKYYWLSKNMAYIEMSSFSDLFIICH